RPQLMSMTGALVIPFEPPALQGVGSLGGFEFELQDRGGNSIEALAKATHDVVVAASQRKELAGMFAGFTADDPQILVSIDRARAKSLDIGFDQIADTLQVYMGSAYVNDFDFNNRAYRVYAQADAEFRSRPKDIGQFYVR